MTPPLLKLPAARVGLQDDGAGTNFEKPTSKRPRSQPRVVPGDEVNINKFHQQKPGHSPGSWLLAPETRGDATWTRRGETKGHTPHVETHRDHHDSTIIRARLAGKWHLVVEIGERYAGSPSSHALPRCLVSNKTGRLCPATQAPKLVHTVCSIGFLLPTTPSLGATQHLFPFGRH